MEPKAGAQLVVEEYKPLSTRVELSDVSDQEITLLTGQNRMTPALQQAIKRVLDQNGVIDSLDEQIKTRKNEEQSIAADQGRIRENMKALKGSPEEKALLQRYTGQLTSRRTAWRRCAASLPTSPPGASRPPINSTRSWGRLPWTRNSEEFPTIFPLDKYDIIAYRR